MNTRIFSRLWLTSLFFLVAVVLRAQQPYMQRMPVLSDSSVKKMNRTVSPSLKVIVEQLRSGKIIDSVKTAERIWLLSNDPLKTNTHVQWMAKELNKEVYRIDLSKLVSKYIGETEKNLEAIFAKAENKEWILFFDETDALFDKRSSVKDSNDRYANQETNYFLLRLQSYTGIVVLAGNEKKSTSQPTLRKFKRIVL